MNGRKMGYRRDIVSVCRGMSRLAVVAEELPSFLYFAGGLDTTIEPVMLCRCQTR